MRSFVQSNGTQTAKVCESLLSNGLIGKHVLLFFMNCRKKDLLFDGTLGILGESMIFLRQFDDLLINMSFTSCPIVI